MQYNKYYIIYNLRRLIVKKDYTFAYFYLVSSITEMTETISRYMLSKKHDINEFDYDMLGNIRKNLTFFLLFAEDLAKEK